MILFMDSQGFKSIVDEMTTEEIFAVWSNFDDSMSAKFFDGLSHDDKMSMTPAEWEASYLGMTSSEFKETFFDEMTVDEIMQVCRFICETFGGVDSYVEGLTVQDWLHMTREEWQAFFVMSDVQYLIEFVHEAHKVEPKIVYHMFKNMPRDMLEDFEHTPELHEEFDKYETETIRRGIRDNHSRDESVFDIAESEPKPNKEQKREQRKKNKKGGKKGGKHHNGEKKHEKKRKNHDGERKKDRKHKNKKAKKHHEQRAEPEDLSYDEFLDWVIENPEFEDYNVDGFEELAEEMREAEYRESEESTAIGSDESSDSDSDSSSNSDDDSSSSDSSSDEMSALEEERRERFRKGRKHGRKGKKHGRKGKKKHLREGAPSDSGDSFEPVPEENLPATLEETELLDMHMLPQASIDRRHGGRHLRRDRGDREERHGGRHEGGHREGGRRHGGHRNRGEHHRGGHHGKHHGKGRMIKWCMILAGALYTVMMVSFLVIFRRFVGHFRQFHTMNELHKQSQELSVQERNRKYEEFCQQNGRCRRAAMRQMINREREWWGTYGHNFPSFMHPHINRAFG